MMMFSDDMRIKKLLMADLVEIYELNNDTRKPFDLIMDEIQ
jgi:hypothetical protein